MRFYDLEEKNTMLRLLTLFALEGILLQFNGSINNFGNNLFATNLGATDSQIGLIQTIPNLVAMLLLLPLGILSDRLKSSRTVPMITLFTMGAGYFLLAFVPFSEALRIPLFFLALAFTVGSTVLYNAQWQNFFGNAVSPKEQNQVLTHRNRYMFLIGIGAPILCGVLMSHRADSSGKLQILQIFFFLCAIIALAQAVTISKIPVPVKDRTPEAITPSSVVGNIKQIFQSRSFLNFFITVVFFYMVWQFDWSMWYIGQVDYLHLNETQMSVYSGVFNIGQLVAVGVISRMVIRRGADYTLSFAAVGLIFCPFIMIVSSLLPTSIRAVAFTAFVTVLNATQCAPGLCIVQIILKIAPKECRSMAISLYTLVITATNCFMPYLGVRLYKALGSDYRAFVLFNIFTAMLRVLSLLLFIYRYRFLKKTAA